MSHFYLLKVIVGLMIIGVAWGLMYRTHLMLSINAWIREYVFSDKVILFSRKRLSLLLFILGTISLFSGIQHVSENLRMPPNIEAKVLEQAQQFFDAKDYPKAIKRCNEILRYDKKNTQAWEILALSEYADGEKDESLRVIENLLKNNPDYSMNQGLFKSILEYKKK